MRLLLICFFLTACATRTPVSDRLSQDHSKHQASAEVAGVPFYPQEVDHCGPSALAMVLAHRGLAVTPADLTELTFTPGKAGSFRSDLVGAARRKGILALEVTDFESALRELALGNPVLVLQNLGLPVAPQWHFAVAFKYDLKKKTITLHSGKIENYELDLRRFEKTWNWGLVTLPPGQLSSLDELTHANGAAGLEAAGLLTEAKLSYEAMLVRWPNSFSAFFGLANVAYAQKNLLRTRDFLVRAQIGYPKEPMVWHNLALVLGELGQIPRAQKAALRALQLATPGEVQEFETNLEAYLPKTATNSLRP